MRSQTFLRVTAAIFALLVALDAAAQSNAAPPSAYIYTAQTSAPVRRAGDVGAGSITWRCQGSTCSTSGPWPQPGIVACRALALQIGPIKSYGRPGALLAAPALAACNAGAPRDVALTAIPPRAQSHAPVSTGIAIATSELSFVGGAVANSAGGGTAAVVISTGELSFVGGALTKATGSDALPVAITTGELSFVGGRQ